VAAWFKDMLCYLYLAKHQKIDLKNSTNIKASEKNKHKFGILKILEIF